MHLSDYAESGYLNLAFRSNSNGFTGRPQVLALALCRNVPSESDTGATIPEVPNAGGYARVVISQANSEWTEVTQVATSGFIENVNVITFPVATADWGMVSGIAIVDSGVYGQGNMWWYGALNSGPRDVKNTDEFKYNVGAFDVYAG